MGICRMKREQTGTKPPDRGNHPTNKSLVHKIPGPVEPASIHPCFLLITGTNVISSLAGLSHLPAGRLAEGVAFPYKHSTHHFLFSQATSTQPQTTAKQIRQSGLHTIP